MSNNGNGTDWNFPTWEQEQEWKRMAEIQARAFQEAADKAAQKAADRARQERMQQQRDAIMRQRIRAAIESDPNYEAKRQQFLKKVQEMKNKGGVYAIIGSILEELSK